jgi:hypothetical protein
VTEFFIFVGVLAGAPPLVFAAAVLLDHLIHGPNRRADGE